MHDEIVAEAPLSEADRAAEWLARHMTAAMQEVVGDRVPIEVETTLFSAEIPLRCALPPLTGPAAPLESFSN